MYALEIDSGLAERQTMVLVYMAFSAIFLISVISSYFTYGFFIVSLFYLGAFTVFSVPHLLLIIYSTQPLDWLGRGFLVMIPMALFYALVAYGLLKKKRVASVAAFISTLLTIFAD
ncbi:MAG: hypothetical protein ACFFDP_09390, partial [Promethearchaeota archaeon]